LPEIFGEYTDEVKKDYLDLSGWQLFKLKSFVDTQQKIDHLFVGLTDEKAGAFMMDSFRSVQKCSSSGTGMIRIDSIPVSQLNIPIHTVVTSTSL